MTLTDKLIDKYRKLVGLEIHVGPWLKIDQQRIDDFARVTGDEQWIHVDPDSVLRKNRRTERPLPMVS